VILFRWYPLKGKNGSDTKDRGSLQVKIAFTVKSGSMLDLNKKEKHRLSVGQLSASNIGISSNIFLNRMYYDFFTFDDCFRWFSNEFE